jgi:hypothetical protein
MATSKSVDTLEQKKTYNNASYTIDTRDENIRKRINTTANDDDCSLRRADMSGI